MSVYHVTAEPGSGPGRVWVLQCVEYPGAISESRSLSDVDRLMREAISWVAEVDQSEVEVELRVILPGDLQRRADSVRHEAADLAERQQAVAAESRSLARDLTGRFSGADTARILGVSPQRVSQIIKS